MDPFGGVPHLLDNQTSTLKVKVTAFYYLSRKLRYLGVLTAGIIKLIDRLIEAKERLRYSTG